MGFKLATPFHFFTGIKIALCFLAVFEQTSLQATNFDPSLTFVSRWVGNNAPYLNKIRFGGGSYVAFQQGLAMSSSLVGVTQDGLQWSTVSVGAQSNGYVAGCGFDGTRWLSVLHSNLNGSLTFYQSTDGALTWQAVEGVSLPSTSMNQVSDFIYTGGAWVLVDSGRIWVSADGVSWVDRSVAEMPAYGTEATFGNGVLVLVGGSKVYRSTDLGQSWTTPLIATTQGLLSVAYGNGRFVAVGNSGVVLTSTDDGVTWVTQASGTTAGLNVVFGDGIFVVTGMGIMSSSYDGIVWTSATGGNVGMGPRLAYGTAGWVGISGWSAIQSVNGLVPPPPMPRLPGMLPNGTVGTAYSATLTSSGATSFTAINLPPGLSLNSTTGQISGTPTTAGTFTSYAYASNAAGTGSYSSFSVTMSNPPENPLITLLGENPIVLWRMTSFTDPGAMVTDNRDTTRTIYGTGTVNTSVNGTYTLTYNAVDADGYPAITRTRTVQVVAENTDITAPQITEFTITPASVDITGSSQTVTMTARITDDLSGLNWANLTFQSSGGSSYWIDFSSSSRISGTATDGVYRRQITIPRYAATGTFTLSSCGFGDASGRSRNYTAQEFSELGFANSFAITGTSDSVAPILTGLSFTPSILDNTQVRPGQGARVYFTLDATDNLSGFSRGEVELSDSMGNWGSAWINSNGRGVAWIQLPAFGPLVNWFVQSIRIYDSAGNTRIYDTASLAAAGFPTTLVVEGMEDTQPLVIAGLTIQPQTVDITDTAAEIFLDVHIIDDVSGPGGGRITIRDPQGTIQQMTGPRISGTAQDGIYRVTVPVPRYGKTGTYTIEKIEADDYAGHHTEMLEADILAADFPMTFQVTGLSDGGGPQITGFSFQPSQVNPAQGGGRTILTAQITDDLSGFVSGTATISSPSGGKTISVYLGSAQRVSGNALSGVYAYEIQIPEFSEAGVWTLQDLSLTDRLGYSTSYDATTLTAAGMESGFTVISGSVLDETAPVLTSLQIAPTVIDVSNGSQSIQVTVGVTDDQSGLYIGTITVGSPSGWTTSINFGVAERIEGSDVNGVYRIQSTVTPYTRVGIWQVQSVVLTDRAGVSTEYWAPFENPNFVTSFEVSGPTDSEGPVLQSWAISPLSAEIIYGATELTFTARFTDSQSGFGGGAVELSGPNGQYHTVYLGKAQRVSGSAQDGVYSAILTLPVTTAGIWQITGFWFSDEQGNQGTPDLSLFADLGFPTSFEVVAPEDVPSDTIPPQLLSLQFEPNVIDVSGGAAEVQVIAQFSDNLSFARDPYLTLSSPSENSWYELNWNSQRVGAPAQPTYNFTLTIPPSLEPGFYRVTSLSVADWAGNSLDLDTFALELLGMNPGFWVSILDITPPVLSLQGNSSMEIVAGAVFVDPGAFVSDNRDGKWTVYSEESVDTSVPGPHTLNYVARDEAGNVSLVEQRMVMVLDTPSGGSTFAGWSGGGVMTESLLEKYIFGGATDASASSEQPQLKNQPGNLVLSVVVRTNDPKILVWGEAASNLEGFSNSAQIQVLNGTASSNQEGVPEGCQRQDFVMPTEGKSRGFLRMKGTLAP